MTLWKVIGMNSCSAPSEPFGSIFLGWSSIVFMSKVSSCPIVWKRRGCPQHHFFLAVFCHFVLHIRQSLRRTVVIYQSGFMKSGRSLFSRCSGGTVHSIRYWRQGLGLPSRPFPPRTAEMSPTSTWIRFPLGLWLSRLCNPLTLFSSSVVTLHIGLSWRLYLLLSDPYILRVVMCHRRLLLLPLFSSAFRPRELQKTYSRESLVATWSGPLLLYPLICYGSSNSIHLLETPLSGMLGLVLQLPFVGLPCVPHSGYCHLSLSS